MEFSMRDKLLFWSIVFLSLLVFTSIWFSNPMNATQKNAAALSENGANSAPSKNTNADLGGTDANSETAPPSAEQIQLDYLYADWCPHCQATRPALLSVTGKLGASVNLSEWNEASRATDPEVAAMYTKYKNEGIFAGFPTIVAHGPKGESFLAGEQTEEGLMVWICGLYTIKPAACG